MVGMRARRGRGGEGGRVAARRAAVVLVVAGSGAVVSVGRGRVYCLLSHVVRYQKRRKT